jgi:hypothetical protein
MRFPFEPSGSGGPTVKSEQLNKALVTILVQTRTVNSTELNP